MTTKQRRCSKKPVLLAILLGLTPTSGAAESPGEALKAFVGNRAAKVAAVDRADSSKLFVLDTEGGDIKKVADDIEVHSPLFDAAGTRVVYTQVGKVYVQPLDGATKREKITDGSEGHFWVDPKSGDEWVYYTDNTKEMKLRWPDSRGVKTHRIKLSDKTTEHVLDWKAGGGPSRDGTHLGAGYASVIIFDVVAGTEHLLYDNAKGQGCNPSMSPDDSYLLMHLDLPHDTFSIRNKQDKLVWQLQKPEGTDEWQHPEWSVDGDFAVATAKEPNGTYSVFVIQLSTQKTLKVLEAGSSGRDWAYPHLWIADAVQQVPSLPEPPPPPANEDGGASPAPDAGVGGTDGGGNNSDGGGNNPDGGGGGCSLNSGPIDTPAAALLLLLLCLLRRRR